MSDDQIGELYDHCMLFARHMLKKCGEFYAFGAVIYPNEQLAAIANASDEGEYPDARSIMQQLTAMMRMQAEDGAIIASAIATNVDIPAKVAALFPDGVRINLESATFARFVYVPYRLAVPPPRSGEVTFAEPISVELSQPQVFMRNAH